MFNQFTIIFDRQWDTYTIALILGVLISMVWLLWRSPQPERSRVFDVCLASIFAGIVVGRGWHVLLNWVFFVDRPQLIYQIHLEGGLNWHGVVIGALLAGWLVARWRGVLFERLLRDAVMIAPLLALCGWYGCATAACAYGAPVERMADYPRVMTWLADDIYRLAEPRFATQPLGMIASALLLLMSIVFVGRGWLSRTRFWLMLIVVSLVSFAIGFLRGDYALQFYDLRVGQWLDLLMIVFAVIMMGRHSRATPAVSD